MQVKKYCRMLKGSILQNAQGEHSAVLLTFIKLPFVFKTFVSSIFEWPFYTDFTLHVNYFYLYRYGVISCCWHLNPEERPKFSQLLACLQDFYTALGRFI